MKRTKKQLPEEALNCARLLFRLIKRNNPNNTATAQHGLQWAEQIRRLHEIDGQPYFLIEAVIRWCQADLFWKRNILSGDKLRKQWNNLTVRMDTAKAKAEERRREQEIRDQQERERIIANKKDVPDFVKQFRKEMTEKLKGRVLPLEIK
jgi:hypothetical protein